jgi:hypothetical protein
MAGFWELEQKGNSSWRSEVREMSRRAPQMVNNNQ